jgi:hypothetical protein
MTTAMIRCIGKTPETTIDILVDSDGGLLRLGEVLATVSKDILWGDRFCLHMLNKQHPGHNIRLGSERNLGSLVYGLVWEQFDELTSFKVGGEDYPVRYSHSQFEIIPAHARNLRRAAWVYQVEFRDYPSEFMNFQNPRRVWIKVMNPTTSFEGWPEDVLAFITLKNAERDLAEKAELEACQ